MYVLEQMHFSWHLIIFDVYVLITVLKFLIPKKIFVLLSVRISVKKKMFKRRHLPVHKV